MGKWIIKYQDFLVLLAWCLFWIIYQSCTGVMTSGYRFMDDHLIVSIVDMLDTKNFFEVCNYYINTYEPIVRFRPMFWVIKVIEGEMIGVNIYCYTFYLSVLAGITSCFLHLFSKNIGFSFLESILFVFFLLIGGQSENWWMTGAAENRGMLFLALILYLLVRKNEDKRDSPLSQITFCMLVIILSLCKESFILFIPALLFVKLFLPTLIEKKSFYNSLKKNLLLSIFLTTIILLELLYIYKRGTNFGYAGVDNSQPISVYYQTLESYFTNNFPTAIFSSFLLSTSLLITLKRKYKEIELEGLVDWYLFLSVLMLAIIIPQVFLYAKSGLTGRYLIPISFGIAFLLIGPLSYVRSYFRILPTSWNVILSLLILSPSLFIVSKRFKQSNYLAASFTNRNYENEMIRSIRTYTINDITKPILIVINPTEIPTLENQTALNVYIKKLLKKMNPVFYYLITSGTEPTELSGFNRDVYQMILNQSENKQIYDIHNKAKITSILIFPPSLEEKFLLDSKDWFFKNNYKKIQEENFIHYYHEK